MFQLSDCAHSTSVSWSTGFARKTHRGMLAALCFHHDSCGGALSKDLIRRENRTPVLRRHDDALTSGTKLAVGVAMCC